MTDRSKLSLIILSTAIIVSAFLCYFAIVGLPASRIEDQVRYVQLNHWNYLLIYGPVNRRLEAGEFQPADSPGEMGWPFVWRATFLTQCCGLDMSLIVPGNPTNLAPYVKPSVERTWVTSIFALIVNFIPVILILFGGIIWYIRIRHDKEIVQSVTPHQEKLKEK